jgi:cupin fold WbuC family metalloprotein
MMRETLDRLTEDAKNSPRLRMSLDLRTNPQDQSQRILNALEPGTVLPIHRHRTTAETVIIIRGSLREDFLMTGVRLLNRMS